MYETHEHECRCLPLTETFHRGVSGKPVPPCQVHGTFGTSGKQADTDAETLALNSDALENKLRGAVGAALTKPRFLDL